MALRRRTRRSSAPEKDVIISIRVPQKTDLAAHLTYGAYTAAKLVLKAPLASSPGSRIMRISHFRKGKSISVLSHSPLTAENVIVSGAEREEINLIDGIPCTQGALCIVYPGKGGLWNCYLFEDIPFHGFKKGKHYPLSPWFDYHFNDTILTIEDELKEPPKPSTELVPRVARKRRRREIRESDLNFEFDDDSIQPDTSESDTDQALDGTILEMKEEESEEMKEAISQGEIDFMRRHYRQLDEMQRVYRRENEILRERSNGNCPICRENLTLVSKQRLAACGHVYCSRDFERLLNARVNGNRRPMCAVCRKDLKEASKLDVISHSIAYAMKFGNPTAWDFDLYLYYFFHRCKRAIYHVGKKMRSWRST